MERNRTKEPNETLSEILSYDAAHQLPRYPTENAIALAGPIAVVLSIPFVLQIMFSK